MPHDPQRSLRDALALYKSVLSSALDPILVIDGRGTIQTASDSVRRVFQWTPDELIGRNISILMPEPHHSSHDGYLETYQRTGVTNILGRTRSFEAIRKDGTIFPIDLSVSRVAGIEPPLPLFTGIIHDCTERQQQEEKIRLLKNLALAVGGASDLTSAMAVTLEQICETTGWDYGEAWVPDARDELLEDTPVRHSRDSRFDRLPELTQGTRFRRGEGLPGRVWRTREPEWIDDLTDVELFGRADAAAIAGLRAAVAIPILSGDDVVAVLAFFVSSPRDEDRQLVDLVTAAVAPLGAVIQRRRAEAARQESERRLREMLERVDLIAVMLDADGNVTFANDYLLDLAGWRRDQVVGQRWTDRFVPRAQRPSVQSIFDEAFRTGGVRRSFENEILCRDGQHRLIAWNNTVVRGAKGETIGVTGLGVDITDRRRAERELARYQHDLESLVKDRTAELETSHDQLRVAERLAAIGTLAAGLGHDMNNVLLPIRCHLDTIEVQELSPGMRGQVEEIRNSISYLQQLADGLHLLALDPEDPDASLESVDVARWWDQYGSLLMKAIPKDARLATSLPTDLPPVRVAPHRLMQALLNLIVNAGEAIGDGGRVRVGARVTADGRFVGIEVSDNGAGMSAEVKRRALEPFFTTKTRGLGTGLGLPLVQGVARNAGGTLRIESEPGRGTSIELLLPAAEVSTGSTTSPSPPSLPGTAGIAVSDARIASLIESLVESFGVVTRRLEGDEPADVVLWITDPVPDRAASARRHASRPGRAVLAVGSPPDTWSGPGLVIVSDPRDFEGLRAQIAEAIALLGRTGP